MVKQSTMTIFKDDEGTELLRLDPTDPKASVAIARVTLVQLRSLHEAITAGIPVMEANDKARVPAPAGGTTETPAPPAAPAERTGGRFGRT